MLDFAMTHRTLRAAVCISALAAANPFALTQQTAAPTVSLSSSYAATTPLADQIAAILAAPAVARDHWGIQVTTLDGTPLYSLNEAQLFQPASNAKLFTTAAALALLGPNTTYQTTVVTRGLDFMGSEGTIPSLSIVGGGDGNLSNRTVPYKSPSQLPSHPEPPGDKKLQRPLEFLEEMADQVVAGGVKVVSGDIIGDDTLFPWEPYPEAWSIDDMVWGYGAPVSALSINDNQLLLTVKPGPMSSDSMKMTPLISIVPTTPYYTTDTFVEEATTKRDSWVQIQRQPGSKALRIFGALTPDADADVVQIAIQDPAEFVSIALKGMLEARGVVVRGVARALHNTDSPVNFIPSTAKMSWELLNSGGNPAGAGCPVARPLPEETFAKHTGPSVADDVVVTNKVSQNLHAELLLHHLGKLVYCGNGSTGAGIVVVRTFLIHAGIDANDFIFYDGSGLSTHDLVTPRATAKLLSYGAHDPATGAPQTWFGVWKSSLPVGGEDGTLGGRFAKPPLKDHIFAKTGTLGEARALSGYLDAASGRTIIFSIMVGNHLPGTSDDREAMDKIVAAIQAGE